MNIGNETPGSGVCVPAWLQPNGSVLQTPGERFDALRQAWRLSEGLRIRIAVLLAEAEDRGDWLTLGFEHPRDYVREVGIPDSTARKLRIIGRVFGDLLLDPPRDISEELAVEPLYVAAQRVQKGQVDADTAIREAAVYPTRVLIEMRDVVVDETRVSAECLVCGDVHWCVREPLSSAKEGNESDGSASGIEPRGSDPRLPPPLSSGVAK